MSLTERKIKWRQRFGVTRSSGRGSTRGTRAAHGPKFPVRFAFSQDLDLYLAVSSSPGCTQRDTSRSRTRRHFRFKAEETGLLSLRPQ